MKSADRKPVLSSMDSGACCNGEDEHAVECQQPALPVRNHVKGCNCLGGMRDARCEEQYQSDVQRQSEAHKGPPLKWSGPKTPAQSALAEATVPPTIHESGFPNTDPWCQTCYPLTRHRPENCPVRKSQLPNYTTNDGKRHHLPRLIEYACEECSRLATRQVLTEARGMGWFCDNHPDEPPPAAALDASLEGEWTGRGNVVTEFAGSVIALKQIRQAMLDFSKTLAPGLRAIHKSMLGFAWVMADLRAAHGLPTPWPEGPDDWEIPGGVTDD